MKLSLALLSPAAGSVASASIIRGDVTPQSSLSAASPIGSSLLSRARRLEQENDEIDYTWVAGMSLKFQGCYHTQKWNDEADEDEDIRISTQRLVRFRLCPSDACSSDDAGGCSASDGYGDYVIGLEEYLESYFGAVEEDREWQAQQNGEDNADDGDDDEEEWDLKEMAECRQYEFRNDGNRRSLEEEEAQYYVGAYCSKNGGDIYLGLFTEDTCSQFADEYGGRETFAALSYGKTLPYSSKAMVGSDCTSCMEYNDNQDDQDDEDEVREACEQLYESSGKCEAALANAGTVAYPNNYACNFMQGIKIVRKDGNIVRYGMGGQNATASIFIGILAFSFVLMGGYVYYLKRKLDRSKVNLSE